MPTPTFLARVTRFSAAQTILTAKQGHSDTLVMHSSPRFYEHLNNALVHDHSVDGTAVFSEKPTLPLIGVRSSEGHNTMSILSTFDLR